jgi:very-short-patch-repair endonuclease
MGPTGIHHPKQKKRDQFRDMILRKEGWMVIRFGEKFTAKEVLNKLHETGLM